MRFFHRVRTLRHWPRALLVGLVLAFGAHAIAHASHRHDPLTPASALLDIACGHCVGGLAPAPAHPLPVLMRHVDHFDVAFTITSPALPRLFSPGQPRGPPEFLDIDPAGLR